MLFKRKISRFAVLALVLAGFASPVQALKPEEAAELKDRFIGKADAPVTIIEYASLTCGHCAHFQTEILPQLKEKYIDTGKVKLIYRDYPLDGIALKAAAVARCMPESSFHAYISVLFKNQSAWVQAEDLPKALGQYARLGGLSQADAEVCAKDEKLMDAIADGRLKADKLYEIKATPTFIASETQEKIEGALEFTDFSAKIDGYLAKADTKAKMEEAKAKVDAAAKMEMPQPDAPADATVKPGDKPKANEKAKADVKSGDAPKAEEKKK